MGCGTFAFRLSYWSVNHSKDLVGSANLWKENVKDAAGGDR